MWQIESSNRELENCFWIVTGAVGIGDSAAPCRRKRKASPKRTERKRRVELEIRPPLAVGNESLQKMGRGRRTGIFFIYLEKQRYYGKTSGPSPPERHCGLKMEKA
jgi:hypothetical protein